MKHPYRPYLIIAALFALAWGMVYSDDPVLYVIVAMAIIVLFAALESGRDTEQ